MEGKLNVAFALDLSLHHISQLVEMLDVNGYCQNTETLREAREFEEELLRFARYRRCCHNCAHCRPDEEAAHVGKTEDPMVCHGFEMYEPCGISSAGDSGVHGMNCTHYACKYEGGNNDQT